jgi:DNA-binding transcriptional ArsR family regulator
MKCNKTLNRYRHPSLKENIFLALSCRQRVKIIELLSSGEKTTQYINEHLDIHPSVISRHLNMLLSAGLISVRREGVGAYWSLSGKRVVDLLSTAEEIVKDIIKERKKLYKALENADND